jgi:hypothetical protein
VAEPWSNDFNALDEHTRKQLGSLETTRTALSTRTQETKMRFFKTHPALAAIVALLALSLVGGAAYAVVREVFITIDPDKPADQIEKDVHDQLEAAGVPSTVHADKLDDGKLQIRIGTTDQNVGSDVKINVNGITGGERQLRLQLKVACELTDAQRDELTAAASGQGIIELAVYRGEKTDDEIVAAVKKIFADAGFHDVDVAVTDGQLEITVKAPPTK